jgi:transmembrane sensor
VDDDDNWPAALAELDPTTLARFFAHECGEEEAAMLCAWIDAIPERREAVDRLHEAWRAAHDVKPSWDVERALGAVTRKYAERQHASSAAARGAPDRAIDQQRRRVIRAARPYRRWLASAAVVLVGTYATLRVIQSRNRGAPAKRVASRVYETNIGERATVSLRDGTRVTLAPASILRAREGYGTETRQVELVGEAYFDVAHDPSRPFRVHTSRGVAEDVGTSFVVTAYDDQPVLRVVVASGRVALDSVELGPGDLGEIDSSGTTTVQHGTNVAEAIAWTEGQLIFNGVPLTEAIARLSRWYGTDIRLGDSTLAKRRVSAVFDDESATEAIGAIARSLHLRIERRESVVTLYSSVNRTPGG